MTPDSNASPKRSALGAALACATAEVSATLSSGESVRWRVKRLSPAELAATGALEGVIGSGIAAADPNPGRPRAMPPDIGAIVGLLGGADRVACLAITGVAFAGEPFEPVRVVSDADFTGAEGTAPVSALGLMTAMEAAFAALGLSREAADRVGSFLRGISGAV